MAEHVVLVGYRLLPADAGTCPYCQGHTFMLVDDGHPDSLAVGCWCGARARVRRDDPDLVRWPDLPPAYLPPRGCGYAEPGGICTGEHGPTQPHVLVDLPSRSP